ncbi:hypothetical protein ACQ86N_00515 [Puia sp. P3]|uniref:hypothetical protein n=1 Tax=Puia sp. P3 TaxID=3423952 RepID=UPI003D6677F6
MKKRGSGQINSFEVEHQRALSLLLEDEQIVLVAVGDVGRPGRVGVRSRTDRPENVHPVFLHLVPK